MYTRRLLFLSALLVPALSCREDAGSPVEPGISATDPLAAASSLAFWQLGAGRAHTCGVTTDNLAYCWGRNFDGQLGDGTAGPGPGNDNFREQPHRVEGGLRFKQVDAGGFSTCGVTTDNLAYCWGGDQNGQLGDGPGSDRRPRPFPVAGSLRFRQVSTGFFHTCGVTTDNRAYCWGEGGNGELGDGTALRRRAPVAVSGALRWKQVSAGDSYTCGVTTTNRAYCWGSNEFGQIGDNSTVQFRRNPVQVAGGRAYTQVEAGDNHACAVSTADVAFCWGRNNSGELGDGTRTMRRAPRRVAGTTLFNRVTAGLGHSCGEATTNRAYCWGGLNGQLRPAQVPGGHAFAQVSAGAEHVCGRTVASVGYCWGSDSDGQLGNGDQLGGGAQPSAVAEPS